MDYRAFADIAVHENWDACQAHFAGRRLFAVTTRGTQRYDTAAYQAGDVFVFGVLATFGPASAVLASGIDSLAGTLRITKRLSSRLATPAASMAARDAPAVRPTPTLRVMVPTEMRAGVARL